ncbi:MAG: hypothetical protein OXC72_07515 [Roseovarius sp.]|nr:hypothetical protein [Roseovarius sp.]
MKMKSMQNTFGLKPALAGSRMSRIPEKKRKTFFPTGVAGACIITFGTLISSCSPGTDSMNIQSESGNAKDVNSQIISSIGIWEEESGPEGDPFSAGVAAWKIANETRDVKWSGEAIRKLNDARQGMPEFTHAAAWLGAAHAPVARDYPIQGIWQVIPGPGFARIHHVKKVENLLDNAVDQSPNDPVFRLIRASTLLQMPGMLTDHKRAYDDIELMAGWSVNPDGNRSHAEILKSADLNGGFMEIHIKFLSNEGMTDTALGHCRQILAQAQNSQDQCPGLSTKS